MLKLLSGVPQRPTFYEEEGARVAADLWEACCDVFGGDVCDLQSAPISPPSRVTKEK